MRTEDISEKLLCLLMQSVTTGSTHTIKCGWIKVVGLTSESVSTTNGNQESGHKSYKGCDPIPVRNSWCNHNWMFSSIANRCDSDTKQHIANMMTVITTSTFALYAAEK